MLGIVSGGLVAFVVTLLAILALRPFAVAVDLIDRPGGRKTHHGDVPIIGGLAMFIGLIAGIGLLPGSDGHAGIFLGLSAVLVTIGLIDDRFELSPWSRLPAHAAAGIALVATGTSVVTLGDPFSVGGITLHGLPSAALTVLLVMGAINAFNMLDGMDGLAGTTAMIATLALGFLAYQTGLSYTFAIGSVIVGSVAAFLIFNLPIQFNRDKRCFMGDTGSTLLGFALAWLCISVSQGPRAGAAPVTMLWIVAMPLYELLWSMIRRLVRGVSPFRADSNHFHHHLLKAEFGVRGAFLVFVALGSSLMLFGLALEHLHVSEAFSFALFIACGIGVVTLMYHATVLRRLLPRSLLRLRPLGELANSDRRTQG